MGVGHARADGAELPFALVLVQAGAQLSHATFSDPSLARAMRTALLFPQHGGCGPGPSRKMDAAPAVPVQAMAVAPTTALLRLHLAAAAKQSDDARWRRTWARWPRHACLHVLADDPTAFLSCDDLGMRRAAQLCVQLTRHP